MMYPNLEAKILFGAICQNKIDYVKNYINQKNDINIIHFDWTPLDTALYTNNFEIINLLVKNGGKINFKNGSHSLWRAVNDENEKAIDIILDLGVSPNFLLFEDGLNHRYIDKEKIYKLINVISKRSLKRKILKINLFLYSSHIFPEDVIREICKFL